jgi:hypothetical protein
MAQLIEHTRFDASNLDEAFDDAVCRYCEFIDLAPEGAHVDATFLSCRFERFENYRGLFNLCLFVDVQFIDCTFQGSFFAGCRFLQCRFVRCRFMPDNLAADCLFDDTQWFDCQADACTGLPAHAVGT